MNSQYTLKGLSNFESKKAVETALNTIEGLTAKVFLPDQVFFTSEIELDLDLIQQTLKNIGDYELVTEQDDIPPHIRANTSPSNQYICPMFCEGDLIHTEPGRCSVCNMFLLPIEQVDRDKPYEHGAHQHQHFSEENAGKYYCPMMCEGDKVYDEMGSCPVCGMNLEKIPDLTHRVEYTCPMHPEIVSASPGSCSICGMDLVPKEPQEEVDETYQELKKKFWISVAFTLPIFILSMGEMIPGNPVGKIISPQHSALVQLVLCLPIIFYTASTYFVRAYHSYKNWNLNMFSLIGLGTSAAFLYSLIALFFPNSFPEEFKTHHGMVGLYIESVAVILTLVILGQLMEAKAHSKTNKAIKELIKLTPHEATLVVNGEEQKVSIHDIKIGDQLKVKPGEKVPIDGSIISGNTDIDESMLTGESVAVSKSPNDKVIGGSLNGSGSFVMQAEKIGQDTLLAKIIQMVNSASRTQAPIQRSVDKISKIFVPTVIIVAVLTFIAWWILGTDNRLNFAFANTIAVLIVACPCALGLATPMSVMVAVGKGAKNGILIKNAASLEQLNQVNVLAIDKTGTITNGKPSIAKIISTGKMSQNQLLQYAASLNQNSSHPVANAFTTKLKSEQLDPLYVTHFQNITGKGVKGTIDNQPLILGNATLMTDLNIPINQFQNNDNTTSFLVINNQLEGYFELHDEIKTTSKGAIQDLQQENIEVVMLTGDNYNTAKKVAKAVGITSFEAEVLPQDKQQFIQKRQKEGKIVAMAGDGINDAPALAQADVAIAMDSGTDVAIESADITLLKGDLNGVKKSIRLSHAMMKNIHQNLGFAFIYNIIGIPIAAGILYPFFGILMSPMIAATAMSLSSVSVILNATRLNQVKL
ncbi:copper-transporting P-type ATPase [Vaginella massiliensis]|uniref:copper-transporting P-type ATPase n=1 Tax=Vaginella massiliensis TaxID=1816680 RepID=UPI000837EC25|nr:copper-translocating P-type ATPase [Vaginella massiliensis]